MSHMVLCRLRDINSTCFKWQGGKLDLVKSGFSLGSLIHLPPITFSYLNLYLTRNS